MIIFTFLYYYFPFIENFFSKAHAMCNLRRTDHALNLFLCIIQIFKAQKIFLPFMLATAVAVVVVFGLFKDDVLLLLRSCCVQDPNPVFNGFFMMTYIQKIYLVLKTKY